MITVSSPTLRISDRISPTIEDKKLGQKVTAIANFKVIEKTKSYVVLYISGLYVIDDRRIL